MKFHFITINYAIQVPFICYPPISSLLFLKSGLALYTIQMVSKLKDSAPLLSCQYLYVWQILSIAPYGTPHEVINA